MRIVWGTSAQSKILPFTGKNNGDINNKNNPLRKTNFKEIFFWNFWVNIFLKRMEIPIEAKTITDIEANTSNLEKDDAIYTPKNPNKITKTTCSLKIFNELFLVKMSQIPIEAKIMNTECNKNEVWMVVVECSDIDATTTSWVVKNGLIAFWYLKLPKSIDRSLDKNTEILNNTKIDENKNNKISLLENFFCFKNIIETKRIVVKIRINPENP